MTKKKPIEYLSRPEKRGPPGRSPLLVIAGLPRSTAKAAAATINNDDQSRWRAIAADFPSQDTEIYESRAVLELGRLTCNSASEGVPDEEDVPSPSRVAIAFVVAPGFEQLWKVFGHAVWPVPLFHPDWHYPKGRHWRHEIEIVNRILQIARTKTEAGVSEELRLRLETQRSDDILLLPGRNFHINSESRLVERFRAFMSGEIDIATIEAGIRTEKFAYERLKEFYKRMGGRGKRFAVDSRDIVFAKSNRGQDGNYSPIPSGIEVTEPRLQRTLESRYRFGTPLKPPGFQHDVQYENGRHFHQVPFECVTKGAIKVSGGHANVFPDDVVTGTTVSPE